MLHGLQNLMSLCLLSLELLITVLFIISLLPMMSLQFLLLLYDIIGGSGKHSLNIRFYV